MQSTLFLLLRNGAARPLPLPRPLPPHPLLPRITLPQKQLTRSFKTTPQQHQNRAPPPPPSHFLRRAKERMGLKETLLQPSTGQTAFGIGRTVVAATSITGLAALAYYGLALSSKPGTLERSLTWPDYVHSRIKTTYAYFGSSILLTGAAAMATFRNPMLMRVVMKNSWLAIGSSLVAIIMSGMVARSLPYKPGFGAKQFAWLTHSSIMGIIIAPITLLGGPLLLRAAWMTAGVIGGLSTIAVCAPSEKFLNLAGPLGIGLGVVFVSSIGTLFFSPLTTLGAGLYSISLYGGLVVFSGFLLYDTQRIIRNAEVVPIGSTAFDPVNESILIYLDTLNIFIRIAQMLAMGGGGGKRK